jgi:hypothetical protein
MIQFQSKNSKLKTEELIDLFLAGIQLHIGGLYEPYVFFPER